jgi:NAD(P)-dependent dehydrogenase (short-subunit alcohol dehydrogenase family)
MLSNRLKGKVAIVTGIGSGIGRGCALMFARHGAQVMSCDIDATTAEEGLELARNEQLDVSSVHPCDLTKPQDVDRLIAATVERFGGVDILVNAAAFGAFAPIQEMEYDDQWRRTLS